MSATVSLKDIAHDFETSLGKDVKTGEDIWISQKARRSGMLILGSTGYGKSGLINHMVASDMRAVIRRKGGRAEKICICVIAPDSDLIDSIISRVPKERENDVILVDPILLVEHDAYFPMNLFACLDLAKPAVVELVVEQVRAVFRKLLGMSHETTPRLANFVQQITRSLLGTGYTLIDVPDILLDGGVRSKAIPAPNSFWKSYNLLKPADQFERAESLLTRVADFADNQIMRYMFGQSAMFDFADAIDSGKIILVNIPEEYEDLSRLVGGVIVGQLLVAMLQRKNTPRSERGLFNLYIDEFQNYVSDSINTMAEKCRKYGLSLTVSHQSDEQKGITDEIKAATRQMGSKIFFHLSNIDGPNVASVFDITPPQAVKPPPVIPANVLSHLHRHPHEAVKSFWRGYVRRWEVAAGKQEKERVRTSTVSGPMHEDVYEETITTYPKFDLGEGVVFFEQRDIEEILFLVNDLLYETQVTGIIPTQKRIALIKHVAPLLGFPTLYRYSYSEASYVPCEQTLSATAQMREEEIAGLEAEIAEKEKALPSDDAFLSLHLQGAWELRARKYAGIWKEWYTEKEQVIYQISHIFQCDKMALGEINGSTKEALWISMQRAASENKRLASFAKYEQWIAARKDMLETMLDELRRERIQEKFKRAPYARVQAEYSRRLRISKWSGGGPPFAKKYENLSFLVENRSWVREITLCHSPLITMPILWPPHGLFTWRFFGELTQEELYSLDFSCCGKIVELDEKIEIVRKHLASDEWMFAYPYDKYHSSAVRTSFIQELADACFLYSSYDSAERILRLNKELYRVEIITPMQDKVAQAKKKLASDLTTLRATLMAEKAPHDRFVNALDTVLSILMTPEGRIAIPSTEWVDTLITQQTFGDREKEISNRLTHLAPRQAMISLPSGEYTMKTHDIPSVANITERKERILQNTIRQFCKSRAQVEEEIAERVRQGSQPQTSRKYTLVSKTQELGKNSHDAERER